MRPRDVRPPEPSVFLGLGIPLATNLLLQYSHLCLDTYVLLNFKTNLHLAPDGAKPDDTEAPTGAAGANPLP